VCALQVGLQHEDGYLSLTTAFKYNNTLFRPRGAGLYKTFVCAFGDCALVNAILDIQHLGLTLIATPPPLYVAINIAQKGFPLGPLCCRSTYNIGNRNIVQRPRWGAGLRFQPIQRHGIIIILVYISYVCVCICKYI